ncbi:MAG: ATP-dependent DNA helicase [Desulfobulbus sp.]|jgi:ATP-dependent DNA helicase DinG|uniref:ATP-dependent DNA helicase n=1 Tax=Desulfobulbus sp. TaxID=895 RepID=UPI00284692BC|nr:ATP-dependent DNA helicase [Desulfobulbus sp.]MDR2549842.1 ATP-dependent DNA helicase [Desulfobulbus sp.]
MDNIFGPDGLLAKHLSPYQYRPGQLEMASAVARLLETPEEYCADLASCLMIEAETGLGKTLAYLIPAVLSGQRVVVSTNTRNLQDQILQREIPFIREWVAPELKALCVKGRQNYLCLYRWRQLQATGQADTQTGGEERAIESWIDETVHGDRSELHWLGSGSPLWQKICCQSHFCLGSQCPEATGCFLNRLRRDAAASQLLIVNHHLLFSDLAVRRTGYGEVLPRYETVLFDEAHHVENVATTFFGFTFSRFQVLDLCGDVERGATDCQESQRDELLAAISRLKGNIERFAAAFPEQKGRFPLQEVLAGHPGLAALRAELAAALQGLAQCLDGKPGDESPWPQYASRAWELAGRLDKIACEQFDDLADEEVSHTYWYERTERNLGLYATPVDVAAELHAALYTQVRHCVFTSATLTTGGNFRYALERLGLPADTPTMSLASPFDYQARTMLYVPNAPFPEPTAPGYPQALHQCMASLIKLAGGRTLALFTSLAAMDKAYPALREQLPYPLLIQGEAPRRVLLQRFCRETDSVLLAVSSFWEGVDVPGESLSLVIIDKLPFEVPSDPVIMARMNRIKALGGNPFNDYQVPRAILTLRQGVGRLMRTADDRGVIAVLDTRLFGKGYGRQFLRSLPPSPVSRDLDDVAAFFGQQPAPHGQPA